MLDFIISNYVIFIVIAIILLLGLFGYMMDRKKYQEYREEIANEERAINALESQPEIATIATPVPVVEAQNIQDPLTGQNQN